MPLKSGKSKKTISGNIHEMMRHPGPRFKKNIRTKGWKKAHQMAVAAAMRKAHQHPE